MDFLMLQNRVLDATLRGGSGNRDQIKEDLNEAIKEVDALLRPSITVVTKPLVANQGDYSLLTDFSITDLTSIRDITYLSPNNTDIVQPLRPASPEYIRERRTTFVYSTYVAIWALDGLDLLMLYPTTQQSGDTIRIYYVPRPANLVNNSDVPVGLPAEWHDLYVVAATYRAMRQTSPEYALMYKQQFDTRLGDYRKWRNRRDGAVPRKAQVGSPGRRLVPHDPSTDWRY